MRFKRLIPVMVISVMLLALLGCESTTHVNYKVDIIESVGFYVLSDVKDEDGNATLDLISELTKENDLEEMANFLADLREITFNRSYKKLTEDEITTKERIKITFTDESYVLVDGFRFVGTRGTVEQIDYLKCDLDKFSELYNKYK